MARRDRILVLAGVVAVIALAWVDIVYLAASMPGMGSMEMGRTGAMPVTQPWVAADLLATFLMWTVMMVAMMVPSAAPMVLAFSALNRRRSPQQERTLALTAMFVSGYVVMWSAFSGVATLGQWGLHELGLLSPMMAATSTALGSTLLVVAGVYQLTPFKDACLAHCRSPLGFLMAEWRDGATGALAMGLRHGAYCLGCCWALMALLFLLGVMNLVWIAALAVFVLLEKVVPGRRWLSRSSGLLLIVWGLALPFAG